MAAPIPTVKVEAMDSRINMEDTPSPSDVGMEDADLVEEEEDLDFSRAQQPLWLSKLPKYLWETLAKISDNDEIELGTIRVEGTLENPTRVSLKLHDAVFCKEMEKEYILKKNTGPQRRLHRPGQVMMFSEKNKPGFKQRANVWDNIDEDGNPGQGRSQLYEAKLKEERRKESKDQEKQKYTPYVRRPIPKITALEGSVQQEFETVPVVNAEYERFEKIRTDRALRILKGDAIQIVEPNVQLHYGSIISQTERQNIGRVSTVVEGFVGAILTRNHSKRATQTARYPYMSHANTDFM